mmetsp:Transcript_16484/g.48528  ORF Transcript_16484/g.48528 Transcript_16484/m.48528 type:complete len:328 (+) Transcript_16484:225-1208(+)
MNGCICCTVRADLVVTLKKLWSKVANFDGVIIETTGLADPAPVAQTFFVDEDIKSKYSLDGIITVVDAKYITTRLDDVKPEGVENEAVEQVVFADKILLNKIDLASGEEELEAIEKRIKSINPTAPITRCQQSKVDPMSLLNIRAFSLDRVLKFEPDFLEDDGEHEHDASVVSCATKFEGNLNCYKLQRYIDGILRGLGADLYRYKGVLSIKEMDDKYVFQGVGMLFSGGFTGAKWKPGEKRECRFVFIGKKLDKEALIEGFHKCKANAELRFKVGDTVEANIGKYTKGKIVKVWDEGNPYRIEIADGEKTNVHAPVDEDAFVRAAK